MQNVENRGRSVLKVFAATTRGSKPIQRGFVLFVLAAELDLLIKQPWFKASMLSGGCKSQALFSLFWYNKKPFFSYSCWFHGLVGFAINGVTLCLLLNSSPRGRIMLTVTTISRFLFFFSKGHAQCQYFYSNLFPAFPCVCFYTASCTQWSEKLISNKKTCAFRKLTRNLRPFKIEWHNNMWLAARPLMTGWWFKAVIVLNSLKIESLDLEDLLCVWRKKEYRKTSGNLFQLEA